MNKRQIIASLVKIANELDENGYNGHALDLDTVIDRIQKGYYHNKRVYDGIHLTPEQEFNSQIPDPNYSWNNTTREKLKGRKIYNEDMILKSQIIRKYEKAYRNGNLRDNTLAEVLILLNHELEKFHFVPLSIFEIKDFGNPKAIY